MGLHLQIFQLTVNPESLFMHDPLSGKRRGQPFIPLDSIYFADMVCTQYE